MGLFEPETDEKGASVAISLVGSAAELRAQESHDAVRGRRGRPGAQEPPVYGLGICFKALLRPY